MWWETPPRNPVGHPREDDVSDEWIVDLVDAWQMQAKREGRGEIADRRAIAELLFEGSTQRAPDIRRAIERALAFEERRSDTEVHAPRASALQRAVASVEGERFEWWVKRLWRATSNLRRRKRT